MLTQLQLSVDGVVVFDPPQVGRPSSPTCAVYNPAGTSVSTPTPTVGSVNTTLSQAAAIGASTITVSSATGIAARQTLLLTDTDGERDWVRVRSVSGSVVTLFERLKSAFTSGSTLQSCRLSVTVPSASIGTIDEGYELRWAYTIDGTVYRAQTRFDVVRSLWPEVIGSTMRLRRYAPGLLTQAREDGTVSDYLDDLEAATERVRREIRARGRDPSRFRGFAAFEDCVYQAVVLKLAEQGDIVPRSFTPEAWLQEQRGSFDHLLSLALQTTRDYDENQDGTVTTAEAALRVDAVRISL